MSAKVQEELSWLHFRMVSISSKYTPQNFTENVVNKNVFNTYELGDGCEESCTMRPYY